MEVWKIIFLSKWVIRRFHVNLPGCTLLRVTNFHGHPTRTSSNIPAVRLSSKLQRLLSADDKRLRKRWLGLEPHDKQKKTLWLCMKPAPNPPPQKKEVVVLCGDHGEIMF